MCLSLCTWNYFFTVSGLSCGQKDVSKAIMTSITVVNKIFNKNNLTVNLTLLLFSPAECLWRGCQRSSRISICPLGELNSSLGLQIPSLFLMCPTGIAGKLHKRLSSAVLMENWYLSQIFYAFQAKTHCPLPFSPVARIFENTLYFLLCSALHVVICWKILNNKTAKRICFVLFCL